MSEPPRTPELEAASPIRANGRMANPLASVGPPLEASTTSPTPSNFDHRFRANLQVQDFACFSSNFTRQNLVPVNVSRNSQNIYRYKILPCFFHGFHQAKSCTCKFRNGASDENFRFRFRGQCQSLSWLALGMAWRILASRTSWS